VYLRRSAAKRKGADGTAGLARCYNITYLEPTMRDAILSIRNRLDGVGVLLSGLCAVHCLLGLLLVSLLGLGGQFLLSPEIHRVGLALAVAVGLVTIGLGALRHGRLEPLLLGACGIALMALAVIAGHGPQEAALTISGVALVAFAHIRNLRPAA
jgi:hypothetical protein